MSQAYAVLLCRCGCGLPARTPKGYAGRRCHLRTLTPTQRRYNFEAWLSRNGRAARQMLAENGSKGGRDTLGKWAELLEKWMELGPREALREAYQRGYRSGYTRGRKTSGYGRKAS